MSGNSNPITKLYELSQREDVKKQLPISGYNLLPLKYWLDIDPKGNYVGIENAQNQKYFLPDRKRASNIAPKLLADRIDYVLGWNSEEIHKEKIEQRFFAFRELIKTCYQKTNDQYIHAIEIFLNQWDRQDPITNNLEPNSTISFRIKIGDSYYIPALADSNPDIPKFWQEYLNQEEKLPTGTCLITGNEGPLVQRLPYFVKGIPGGQPSGTALVSANAPSSCAWGYENSLTSPLSPNASEGFVKALNFLIANRRTRTNLGEITYISWTKEATAINISLLINKPSGESIKKRLYKHCTYLKKTQNTNTYYGMAITPNSSRLSLRNYIDINLISALENYLTFLDNQKIVNHEGKIPEKWAYLSFKTLISSFKNEEPQLVVELIKSLGMNTPIPKKLDQIIHKQICKSCNVTRTQASIIKWALASRYPKWQKMCGTEFASWFPYPAAESAYTYGRILAFWGKVQYLAEQKDSIVEKYGRLSQNPGLHLTEVMRLGENYLNKIPRENAYSKQKLNEELKSFPQVQSLKILNTEEQSFFNQGFYHQKTKVKNND